MSTKPKTPAEEYRFLGTEIRAKKTESGVTVTGCAARYNILSDDLGGFKEIIKPGAFRRAVEEGQDVRMLLNHDSSIVLARTKSGTLKLEEAVDGLRFEASLPDTQAARDLVASVERGDIDSMSFGFCAVRDDWKMDGPIWVRELLDVDLFDVSPVAFSAYPDTSIAKRHLAEVQGDVHSRTATRRCRQMQAEAELALTTTPEG